MASNNQRPGATPGPDEAPIDSRSSVDSPHRLTEEELTRHRPRTIAGRMAEILMLQSEDRAKLSALSAKFEHFVNADPARLLDPRRIRPCPWGGRSRSSAPSSLDSELTASIEAHGVNVQPIKVRRLAADPEPHDSIFEYELVFGMRRLRACASLGLQVSAVIASLEQREAFIESMVEKQGTSSPLSPHDMGVMLTWALEEQLFPSQRSLINRLGASAREVERAIVIASLPKPVIDAFPTPSDIRASWAERLASAVMFDEEGVVAKAQTLCAPQAKLSAIEVLRQLCDN